MRQPTLEEIQAELARREFGEFLKWTTPQFCWDWAWQEYVKAQLKRMTAGELRKLMLFVPPQHGKSGLVTERYSVYRLKRNPGLRIIIGSYNKDYATWFGRHTRRLAEKAGIIVKSDKDASRAQSEWETQEGGGIVSVGVGTGVTGRRGDLIIIDDPVKSREEAESEAYRKRVWEWFTDDINTRLQQNGQMILIMTRWHQSDLGGRILDSEDGSNWTTINLPAEAEENDPLGRKIGDPLCPERFDKSALEEKRAILGSYGFAALYQGRPIPREGGLFKRSWFEIVQAAPKCDIKSVRYWDLAASAGEGDWTVGLKMSRTKDGVFYVEDVQRIQGSPFEAEKLIKQTAALDGKAVRIRMEQEPGSSGKGIIANYGRMLAGYTFKGIPTTGSKELRAGPFAAQCEAGNVKIVKADWNSTFLDELSVFPNGAHDDIVDGSSGAFNELVKLPRQITAGRSLY